MKADIIQKYKKKKLSWLLEKARETFNEFIRLRDSDQYGNFTCISCGVTKVKSQLQAGHYYPAGQNPAVRFDERNVNGECIHCNYYSGNHLIGYAINLKAKIGEQEFKQLEQKQKRGKSFHKWDRFTLIEIIETYRPKVKDLRKTKI
jgi:hypothetical protein